MHLILFTPKPHLLRSVWWLAWWWRRRRRRLYIFQFIIDLLFSLFLFERRACSQGIPRNGQRRIRGKMEKSGESKWRQFFGKNSFSFFFCFSSRFFGQRQERLWGQMVEKWQSKLDSFIFFYFQWSATKALSCSELGRLTAPHDQVVSKRRVVNHKH